MQKGPALALLDRTLDGPLVRRKTSVGTLCPVRAQRRRLAPRLYSEFSGQRQSNPSSFTANVEWWRRTLEAFVLNGWQARRGAESSVPDRLVLHATGSVLTEEFRVEGVGRPLGLATVIVSRLITRYGNLS